jgi:flagellar biosynthesis/type III secretory pathway M-ring protein FliF/YscJ
VKGAVGFSEARGDKIEVACVPFQTEPAPAAEGMAARLLAVLGGWAPALVVRLLAVAFAAAMLLWVVRPLVLALAARPAAAPAPPVTSLAGLEIAAAQLTQENLALAQQNPERAAQLVREWLQEGHAAIAQGD